MELDILSTSVGRELIQETYVSTLQRLNFDGRLNVSVVIDPTYQVSENEIKNTVLWLEDLPNIDSRVVSVSIRKFSRNLGLQRAILTLFTMARTRYALYLEDDWRCLGPINVVNFIAALDELKAGMIALTSPTAAANGTFERSNEAVPRRVCSVDLHRLQTPSWAANYLPLHPHIHDALMWPSVYVQALMESDSPDRCPDEQVRDWVRKKNARDDCPVYWTKDIVFEDIGREWLAKRSMAKNIAADRFAPCLPDPPGVEAEHGLSSNYYKRALNVIPGETQTFMKRRCNFPSKGFPIYIASGDGPFVEDVDGNGYIDMVAGLGALSLGHNHTAVTTAIEAQAPLGLLHSLPTLAELEASETISALNPETPKVRFFKNGGDATASAIRLARAATGRDMFLSCGYHGCGDIFMANTPGVPKSTSNLSEVIDPFAEISTYNSLESALARHKQEIAAVIVALPYNKQMTKARIQEMEARTKAAGALFILDEIVTGIRFQNGSATCCFDLDPDVITWGKSIAAGAPLAALSMKDTLSETMADLHISATYGGDTLSLAICQSVLKFCAGSNYAERIAIAGRIFAESVNQAARNLGLPEAIVGYPTIPFFVLSKDPHVHVTRMRHLQREAAYEGVLLREDANFITEGFSQDIAIEAADRVNRALNRCFKDF
ncbi:aminotransferase class III-fold pyridoxal phosphate-dependent enzyme [Lentilitoribacter sp. EG35]|uniref:aminotransferase class III-fold pyridoxal phosphate-dependent enzyme n=1 Tax=Lentilitoribacter sp. EG35 TaxID=3234192 RepID=UPI00345F96B8